MYEEKTSATPTDELKSDLPSYVATPTTARSSCSDRLKYYCNPVDSRHEDHFQAAPSKFNQIIIRDIVAGLVLAMVGIPMAMCFAIASGLPPAQAIISGAISGLIGTLFGGSKYQVYGPTAAFIPVINGIMALNTKGGPFYNHQLSQDEIFEQGHGLLVFISIAAGAVLLILSLVRAGSLVSKIPNCVMVGFTVGIAVTISFAFLEEGLGIEKSGTFQGTVFKLRHVYEHIGQFNLYSLVVASSTVLFIQALSRVSMLIPAALLALLFWTMIVETVWSDKHLTNVFESYGHIDQHVTYTPPRLYPLEGSSLMLTRPTIEAFGQISYYILYVLFIGAVESLLCSRMADSLAQNMGTPFDPNKELWGNGMVNMIAPLFNGFPQTGSFARTAVNIKVGAATPVAGIVQFCFKLAMIFTFTKQLELLPMAAITGLLWYVALNMISPAEITKVHKSGGPEEACILWTTALLVVVTDVLKGVALAIIIYVIRWATRKYVSKSGDESGTDEEKEPMLSDSMESGMTN